MCESLQYSDITKQTESDMKYKAQQLNNGNWAVMAGSKYFTSTETDSQEQAEKMAIIATIGAIIFAKILGLTT
jgi:spore germination cell wall hydrolase CwlJ-like protein